MGPAFRALVMSGPPGVKGLGSEGWRAGDTPLYRAVAATISRMDAMTRPGRRSLLSPLLPASEIIFTRADPTITPSAPAVAYAATCAGPETPKPIATGSDPLRLLTRASRGMASAGTVSLTPVTPVVETR